MKNHFKTLGLTHNATSQEIKAAYRLYSKKYHPDLNNGDKYYEEKFKEVQEAYEYLCDPYYISAYKDYINNPQPSQQAYTYQEPNYSPPPPPVKEKNESLPYIVRGIIIFLIVMLRQTACKDSYDYSSSNFTGAEVIINNYHFDSTKQMLIPNKAGLDTININNYNISIDSIIHK